MKSQRRIFPALYWTGTAMALAVALTYLLAFTPTESTMGPVQKIFYLHLPLAINTFLSAMIVFIASIGYLAQQSPKWDELAEAAAKVAVVCGAGVLMTGILWGRYAWGHWWTWSPRLTFSLMLWLLYAVYLMVRSSIESPQRAAVCAAYGLMAFLDVPLVWLSAKMMPDVHPASIKLAGSMKIALLLWAVPVTMLAMGTIATRFRLNRITRELKTTPTTRTRRAFPVIAKSTPKAPPAMGRMVGGVQ